MTIGANFLNRVLTEKKKEPEAPKTFSGDAGTERMKMMMRDIGGPDDLADKIADVLNASGVPGAFLNKDEIRKAVIDAATLLRGQRTRKNMFMALHSVLTSFRAGEPVKGGGGSGVVADKKGAVGEKDLGTGFQELVAEVLSSLGAPEMYFTKDAPAALRTSFKSAVNAMQKNAEVKAAFQALARGSRIRKGDGKVGLKQEAVELVEAPSIDNDPEVVKMVKDVCTALGVFDTAKNGVVRVNDIWERSVKAKVVANPKLKMAMKNFLRVVG